MENKKVDENDGAQHPKADAGRMYLQRCDEGRDIIEVSYCVQIEAHGLEKYLNKKYVAAE